MGLSVLNLANPINSCMEMQNEVNVNVKARKKAWKTSISCPQFIECFSLLGHTFPPSDRLISELSRLICLLYRDVASVDINIFRYNLFKLGKCFRICFQNREV